MVRGSRVCAGLPAPSVDSTWAGSRTSTEENPPRRSAPARASPPSAPLDLGPSGSPVVAAFHQPSECTDARSRSAGTRPRAARRGSLRRSDPRRTAPPPRSSGYRALPTRGSSSLASMLRRGRHASTRDRTVHGIDAPVTAWPLPTAGAEVVALCRSAHAARGSWIRSCRSCPRAYLRCQHALSRGPSLPRRCSSPRSSVLRPRRTSAARCRP